MSAATDFAQLLKLTPQAAVAWLVKNGKLTKSFAWQDVWQEEHGEQFTVSRLARLDLLQALHDGLVQSVEGDLSRKDWMRDTEELLRSAGWWGKKAVTDPVTNELVYTTFDPARLKLIYDTNTRQAYSAGLWERIERNKKTHPYVRYISKQDERVRVSHKAWNNLTLPVDDPFWVTHGPANGHRCRCRVMSMSQRDYDKGYTLDRPGAEIVRIDSETRLPDGKSGRDAPIVKTPLKKVAPEVKWREYINPRTGKISQVPEGIDPGFAYNPGIARKEALKSVVEGKLKGASPGIAAAAKKDGL